MIPVFIPERRPASNAHVERYNGLWQEKVWKRYRFRSWGHLQRGSQAFQEAYNTCLKKRASHQGQSQLFQVARRPLAKRVRLPHPLTLCRGQIWFIRRIDEDDHIQILNETIRLSTRYVHEFVRVVLRTGPQTLSVYWQPSGQGHCSALLIDLTNFVKKLRRYCSKTLAEELTLTDHLSDCARYLGITNQLSPIPLGSNSKCNTSGSDGLRCCHEKEILLPLECRRT